MEARLRRFDGEYRWFLISANPMRDHAGQIVKWYAVSTDIDDRERQRRNCGAARHSSRKLRI
jgi:PAS domain S-box-containing protein